MRLSYIEKYEIILNSSRNQILSAIYHTGLNLGTDLGLLLTILLQKWEVENMQKNK